MRAVKLKSLAPGNQSLHEQYIQLIEQAVDDYQDRYQRRVQEVYDIKTMLDKARNHVISVVELDHFINGLLATMQRGPTHRSQLERHLKKYRKTFLKQQRVSLHEINPDSDIKANLSYNSELVSEASENLEMVEAMQSLSAEKEQIERDFMVLQAQVQTTIANLETAVHETISHLQESIVAYQDAIHEHVKLEQAMQEAVEALHESYSQLVDANHDDQKQLAAQVRTINTYFKSVIANSRKRHSEGLLKRFSSRKHKHDNSKETAAPAEEAISEKTIKQARREFREKQGEIYEAFTNVLEDFPSAAALGRNDIMVSRLEVLANLAKTQLTVTPVDTSLLVQTTGDLFNAAKEKFGTEAILRVAEDQHIQPKPVASLVTEAKTASAPPPPPMPAPQKTAPPPPPAPPKSVTRIPDASPRGDLLASISNGSFKLKSVADNPSAAKPSTSDPMAKMFGEMQKVKLKSVSVVRKEPQSTDEDNELYRALREKFKHVNVSESSDDDSFDFESDEFAP